MTGRARADRMVRGMTVPTGPRLLAWLPDLTAALDGTGPALLPLGADDPRAPDIARSLGAGRPLDAGEDDPADPTALVVPTSGSTGAPKGVLLSAQQLAASAAATEARLGGPGHWLLALPAQYIAGMQVLLRAARAGTEPVVLETAQGFSPQDFVIHAERLAGRRRYVSLVPAQLRRVLAHTAAATATAEIFDAVLVGGSAAPADLLAAARSAGIPVVTTYGMTETCGGCVYDGVPLDGVTVTENPSGALVITGPMVARGYRARPADPAFEPPGSFTTADSGAVDANGRVTVTGRVDDIIITGGVKVAPAPVEQALLALDGIDDAVVVGTPDPRWGQAVTAVVVGDAWGLGELRTALTDLPPAHRPQRIVGLERIPQLPSGKPDRTAVRALVRARGPAGPEAR